MVIHKAMLKYGPAAFKAEIIEECDDSSLHEREQFWIEYYDSYKNGYNSTLGGEGALKYEYEIFLNLWNDGMPITDISKITGAERHTVTKALKANNISEAQIITRSLGKPILQYTLEGAFVKRFESLSDAAKQFGNGNISNIKNCCQQRIYSAYNFLWKYEDDDTPIDVFVKNYQQSGRGGTKKVEQYDLDGNFLNVYSSCREAARLLNLPYHVAISACCLGRQKTAYGYIWKYKQDKDLKRGESKNE